MGTKQSSPPSSSACDRLIVPKARYATQSYPQMHAVLYHTRSSCSAVLFDTDRDGQDMDKYVLCTRDRKIMLVVVTTADDVFGIFTPHGISRYAQPVGLKRHLFFLLNTRWQGAPCPMCWAQCKPQQAVLEANNVRYEFHQYCRQGPVGEHTLLRDNRSFYYEHVLYERDSNDDMHTTALAEGLLDVSAPLGDECKAVGMHVLYSGFRAGAIPQRFFAKRVLVVGLE